jgi:hypothetical protein
MRFGRLTLLISAFATGALSCGAPTVLIFAFVAAAHFNDLPEAYYPWFDRFCWATFAIPVTWVASFVLAIREVSGRNRFRRQLVLLSLPAAPVGLLLLGSNLLFLLVSH